MNYKNLLAILFITITINFCTAQVHSEHKDTFIIDSYNYNTTNDGLLLNDIKLILKSRNQETTSNDGKKITVVYNVISNVDIRYQADSYRYKGKVYKLSDIGLTGYKPPVAHRVFTNYGNNWEGKNAPFGYGGIDALKYANQSNMDTPYDLTLIKITKAYITNSQDTNIEAQIESYIKRIKREEKEKEAQNQPGKLAKTTPRKKKEIRMATDDDFWSGESTSDTSTSNDDFWSGEESSTTSKEDDDDFWSGEDITAKTNEANVSSASSTENTEIELSSDNYKYTVKVKGTNTVLLSVDRSDYTLSLINCEDCDVRNKYLIRIKNGAGNSPYTLINTKGEKILGPYWRLYYTERDSDYDHPIFYAQEYISERKTRTNSSYINFEYTYVTTKVTIYNMDFEVINSFEREERI